MTSAAIPTCEVLGIRCAVGDLTSASHAVIKRALSGDGGYAAFCNVHVLMTARGELAVRSALNSAWMVFPDGAPVAWWQRKAGFEGAERVGGPDLMSAVLDAGRSREIRHALFGSTPEVIAALHHQIESRFPGVTLVEAYAPARDEEDTRPAIERLAAGCPHIVWCALGAPKQELWMHRFAPQLAPALVLGVGAAFDFHAGTKARAPQWMQSLGLEWLHRFATEPKRLGRRYLITNSQFILLSLRRYAGSRTSRT